MNKISCILADITTVEADAIVNAANSSLLGGGGVDGAIHRAAGPELLYACRLLNGCPAGQARITGGFKLPARYVIHTVGPVWRGGNNREEETLASCYTECLSLAVKHGCHSIAFPNISTGVYGFPKDKAARIAIQTVKQFLQTSPVPLTVTFVCFENVNFDLYNSMLPD